MKKFNEYADFDLAKINSEILEFWKNENVFKTQLYKIKLKKYKIFIFSQFFIEFKLI